MLKKLLILTTCIGLCSAMDDKENQKNSNDKVQKNTEHSLVPIETLDINKKSSEQHNTENPFKDIPLKEEETTSNSTQNSNTTNNEVKETVRIVQHKEKKCIIF